ncbi:MAG TPA: CoA transferase [Dehalococcoidia bacterium]|nr:CoA transferase [Dehalococcoidia bacterium]
MAAALDDLRVLDLSGPIGHYAGRLLADLGADVIKVEPPGGDAARTYAPYLPDVDAPENGLQFLLLNANKRGVTIDPSHDRGRELLLRLIESADVLIESWRPQEAAALGLSVSDLEAAKPELIHASLTGWGLSGPRAQWAYADIVGLAMSGVMTLAGFADGPPEQLPDLQGFHCASIDATAGIMAAVLHRDATGEGQLVEVSMQEALSMAQETAMQEADINGNDRVRDAGGALGFTIPGLGLYECADGYVYLMVAGLAGAGFQGLVDLMASTDEAGDLTEEPYATFIRESMNRALLTQLATDPSGLGDLLAKLAHIQEVVVAFMFKHPKEYLYEEAQARRVLAGMVSTPEDISINKQLAGRGWWREIEDAGRGKTLRYPGPPWQFEGTPATLRRAAPLLGEHNQEIFGELGLSTDEIGALATEGAI